MKNFEQLPYKIAKNAFLYGYKRPTKVEESAIPLIEQHKSVLLQSPTGSGKTAAFVIGTYLAISPLSSTLQAMIISPTRELSEQTYSVFENLTDLKVALVLTQIDLFNFFKKSYEVVVTTVDRFSKLFSPKTVKLIIFDEVDQMITEKPEIMEKISLSCQEKECVLCSATFSEQNLAQLKQLFKISSEVEISTTKTPSSNKHYMHICPDEEKRSVLFSILQTFVFNECVIFCNQRKSVEAIWGYLRQHKFNASVLHSGIAQSDRIEVMRQFSSGESRILVCTDLFGRGMDVREINLVVNLDMPTTMETFEHRSGRGGRFGRTGVVVTVCDDIGADNVREWWKSLGLAGEVI